MDKELSSETGRANVKKIKSTKRADEGKHAKNDKSDPSLIGITARKNDDLSEWYQQVLTKGGMISYYDVSGCYILKPWSWSIWKKIEAFFTERIEQMRVEECNFPLFISQDNLQREKEHIAGFAAEVAWVTHG